MTYLISTDSSSDASRAFLKDNQIPVINYKYQVGENIYEDDGGLTLPYDDFYQTLADGQTSKTSAINSQEYIDYFTPLLDQGQDIIHIALSSGLSSSYDNALLAKGQLEEAYPNRKIYIVDSLMASSGIYLMLVKLVELRGQGLSIDELFDWIQANKGRVNAWYSTTDLNHFVRGGRISAPVGWLGGKLKICPLMNVDDQGQLGISEVVRSSKKSLASLAGKFDETGQTDENVAIIHSMLKEEAGQLKDQLLAKYPQLEGRLSINRIGTTIGSHTGPNTLGIFFWTDKNRWEN